jgi:hypothetical protein
MVALIQPPIGGHEIEKATLGQTGGQLRAQSRVYDSGGQKAESRSFPGFRR